MYIWNEDSAIKGLQGPKDEFGNDYKTFGLFNGTDVNDQYLLDWADKKARELDIIHWRQKPEIEDGHIYFRVSVNS